MIRSEVEVHECSSDKSRPHILGIDEAGRGPVLGPMVYGACWCAEEDKGVLTTIGAADSKVLSAEKRESVFELLLQRNNLISFALDILQASELSARMMARDRESLNDISHKSAIRLIGSALNRGFNITSVFVDTVGDPGKYKSLLVRAFEDCGHTIDFTVAAKADSKFPVVSAASVCAKVRRDEVIQSWKFEEPGFVSSCPTGSGYPSDPTTKHWLAAHCDPVFGFPRLVRFSWGTAKTILGDKCADVDWGSDEEEEEEDCSWFTSGKSVRRFEFYEVNGVSSAGEMDL